jgi:hypothetical protein
MLSNRIWKLGKVNNMARLNSDNLTLEIKFDILEVDWIAYEISFLWKNDLIVNDNILKKNRWWDRRKYGTFLANDYKADSLIEIIRNCLITNKPEYWEPIEPDAKIGIYPEIYFPFLKDHWVEIEDTGEKVIQAEEQIQDTSKFELFTIIAFIDKYSFKDCDSYSSEGISLHIIATRKELETFVTDLETEYNKLIMKH